MMWSNSNGGVTCVNDVENVAWVNQVTVNLSKQCVHVGRVFRCNSDVQDTV